MRANKNSSELYDAEDVAHKTSKILAAIEACSCPHCISILKSGLGDLTSNHADDDATNQGQVGYDYNI